MTTTDTLVEQYYALKPAEFGFLECLELRQSVQPEKWTGFTLKLRLRSSTIRGAKCLSLIFSDVHDLRIGSLEGLLKFFLEIRSIRERQLEGLNYSVVESEYNAFVFVCGSFVATVDTN
jgi:hypothetical protein